MDKRSQDKLNSIVAKDVTAVTEADKAFLRARRSYLNSEQLNKFSFIFGGDSGAVEPKKDDQVQSLEESSYKELQVIAKRFGIKKTVGISREKLIASIRGTDWM